MPPATAITGAYQSFLQLFDIYLEIVHNLRYNYFPFELFLFLFVFKKVCGG